MNACAASAISQMLIILMAAWFDMIKGQIAVTTAMIKLDGVIYPDFSFFQFLLVFVPILWVAGPSYLLYYYIIIIKNNNDEIVV